MGVTALGDVAWKPVTYPLWSVDGFGMDTATVRYNGLAALKESFENGIAKFGPMPAIFGTDVPGYPSMSLESWKDSEGTANIYYLDALYRGFRSGVIPTPKNVDGTSAQSAQGQGTDTGTIDPSTGQNAQVSGSVYYYASRTTWTWFETSSPPQTPRYATVNNPVNPFQTIYKYSIVAVNSATGTSGAPINNVPYSAFVAVLNSLVPVIRVTDYVRELVIPNKLWACQSIIDYTLQ